MLGKIFKDVFSKPYEGTLPTSSAQSKSPYEPLNQVSRGFARSVERYVETGEDNHVLDVLSNSKANFNSVFASVAGTLGGAPEKLVRVSKLRATSGVASNRDFGTRSESLRELFTLLQFTSYSGDRTSPTTAEDAANATKLLGGRDVDFVYFLLPKERYHSYPNVLLINEYVDGLDPIVLIEALEKCDTKAKNAVFENWKGRAVVKAPGFLSYLFEQLSESSSKLREAARALILHHDPARVESLAIKGLSSRKSAERVSCVQVLGALGTASALEALAAHREAEKSQTVLSTLDLFLEAPQAAQQVDGGYIDAHGALVELPTYDALVDDGSRPVGDDILRKFLELEEKFYQEEVDRYNNLVEYQKKMGLERSSKHPVRRLFAKELVETLNSPVEPETGNRLYSAPWRYHDEFNAVLLSALYLLPMKRCVGLACMTFRTAMSLLERGDATHAYVTDAIRNERISFVQVINEAEALDLWIDYGHKTEDTSDSYHARLVKKLLQRSNYHYEKLSVPKGIWEVAAGHIPLLVETLPPRNLDVKTILNALDIIADFPSVPQDLVQPLVFTSLDARLKVQEPAQRLLRDVPGINDQLIALLSDKRQAVRANTARFLADRQASEALPAIVKRLKTEKSDVARSDMISAVVRLGGETEPYLGKAALLKEAQSFVAKLPNAKIDWLDLALAPPLHWKDGTSADPVLLDAWLRLALKLKSPKGSSLFKLYFEQLTPECAAAVSDWVLDAWISYDIFRPEGDALRAKAMTMAQQAMTNKNNWMVHVGYTVEQIADAYYANMASTYANSGSDSKGILALTHCATPATSGTRIAMYLKQHGRRVSQAKALVETLHGMGSQDAVQVLVATATRFRQRTVRELAEKLVSELAEERGWTEDQLADRSVPTGGFEMDGLLPLPIGDEGKDYVAQLSDDLTITLQNPDGKTVKSLPAGKDENTKESKALLSAARKALKAVRVQQEARIYEAMLTPRVWSRDDWQTDILGHPVMQRLAVRLIWRGLDEAGALVSTLRPTPEGDFWNAEGDDVDLSAIQKIDLAHTANLDEKTREAWLQHLKDFEVALLFAQVSRPVRALSEEQKTSMHLEDRKGWMMTTFKLRSAAKKAGYERGSVEDGGGFSHYRKEFRRAGVWADLHFTGSYAGGEEDIPAAITHMQFTQIASGHAMLLGNVPSLLLSEVWNDLHEIAKVGAFDEDWESKGLY